MTFEVELKFRVSDHEALRQRLSELGASPEPVESQADLYLAHPCRDFVQTDEAVRIRTIGSQSWLTYKGPALDSVVKSRQEIELPLGDETARQQWESVFQLLGFRPVLTVRKTRQPFSLEIDSRSFHVSLDDVAPLGRFVELELLTEQGDLSAAQAAVQSLAARLRLENIEPKTYRELLLELTSGAVPA